MKRPNKACDSRLLAAALAAVSLIAAASSMPAKSEANSGDCAVDLHKRDIAGRISYWVPVVIGRDTAPPGVAIMAMLDTGFAGDLALPRSLVERLRARGAVVLSPGKVTTRLADGSTVENSVASAEASFPGCAAFNYVEIIVTDDRAVPLLGQDILSMSASVNIDYTNLRLDLRGLIWSSTPPCTPATCRLDPNAKPFFLGETPR